MPSSAAVGLRFGRALTIQVLKVMPGRKMLPTLLATAGITVLLPLYIILGKTSYQRIDKDALLYVNKSPRQATFSKDLVVDTPWCQIPDLDPWDRTITKYNVYPKLTLRCPYVPLLTYIDGQWIRINKNIKQVNYNDDFSFCEYRGIIFPEKKGRDFEYAEESDTHFTDDLIPKYEFVRVQCYGKDGRLIYLYYHYVLLVKPRVEKRCDQADAAFRDKHPTFERFNVALIVMDGMSRSNFARSLGKTRNYLINDMKAVELRGHHILGDGTLRNMFVLLAGKYMTEVLDNPSTPTENADVVPLIWKNFSDLGYRVLYNEDGVYDYTFTMFGPGFTKPPADYYTRPIDVAIGQELRIRKGKHKFCIGPKLQVESVIDYTTRFMRTFQNKPHFSFTFLARITHDYVNYAKIVDATYQNNLRRLHEQGLLNNTVLIVFGDHGMRFGKIRQQYVGSLEERLPGMYIVLPPTFHAKYPRHVANLRTNVNRLTSHFDIYETLKSLLEFSGEIQTADLTKRGISLFSEIPPERTCEQASLDAHYCTCRRADVISTDDPIVKRAATVLIDDFNKELAIYNGKCAIVSMKTIFSVRKLTDVTPTKHDYYRMILKTRPGSGILEATFEHSLTDDVLRWTGALSRLNWYGGDTQCVKYQMHKFFCVCR